MGIARNDITGDLIRTRPSTTYASNYEQVFGKKGPEKGRFRQDKETGEFIPLDEWVRKYGSERKQGPMVICNHFEPFESPVTGEVIQNKRQHNYDLDRNGCRVYEGRESEQKEADRYWKYQDEKFEQKIDHTLNQTAYDIEHGYLKVEDE